MAKIFFNIWPFTTKKCLANSSPFMPKSVQNFFQILSLKMPKTFIAFSYFIFDSLFLIKVMKQSLTNWYGIGMVIIKTLSTAVGI